MTIEKLNEIKRLEKTVRILERRLAEARARACSVTSAQSGMPHATGVSDKVGQGVCDIDELRRKLVLAKSRRARLIRYIRAVEDDYIRQIMILRFLRGYTWNSIAMLMGGGNTGDGVRKMCERYHVKKADKTRGTRA